MEGGREPSPVQCADRGSAGRKSGRGHRGRQGWERARDWSENRGGNLELTRVGKVSIYLPRYLPNYLGSCVVLYRILFVL